MLLTAVGRDRGVSVSGVVWVRYAVVNTVVRNVVTAAAEITVTVRVAVTETVTVRAVAATSSSGMRRQARMGGGAATCPTSSLAFLGGRSYTGSGRKRVRGRFQSGRLLRDPLLSVQECDAGAAPVQGAMWFKGVVYVFQGASVGFADAGRASALAKRLALGMYHIYSSNRCNILTKSAQEVTRGVI